MWRKENLIYHCCKCKLVLPLWGTVWRLLKELKIELTYDPEISLLDVYPKAILSAYQRQFYTLHTYCYAIHNS
jgi:hypothetical protein